MFLSVNHSFDLLATILEQVNCICHGNVTFLSYLYFGNTEQDVGFFCKAKNIKRMFYVSRNEATHIYGRRVKRERQK